MNTQLLCRSLPEFPAHDWDRVQSTFVPAATCQMAQAWLTAPEPAFQPATVRFGSKAESLWIYATLCDLDIFNAATKPNQPAWRLGDVFEIFLRPQGQDAYFELHITPENQVLQLRWPDAEAVNNNIGWRKFAIDRPLFSSRTIIENGLWRVLAEIPVANLLENQTSESGHEWLFSFCRYDVTRGQEEPVLSSTSPHCEPCFHQQSAWRRFIWMPDTSFS
jgi:hypothetical protein